MVDPSNAALAWAVRELSGRLVAVKDLHEGRGPWLVTVAECGSERWAVLRVADEWGKETSYVRTEATVLVLAERSMLAAPRLISLDADGSDAGRVASLQTALPGNTLHGDPTAPEQLRAVGAHLAAVHGIRPQPDSNLSDRMQHVDVYRSDDFDTAHDGERTDPLEPGEDVTSGYRRTSMTPRTRVAAHLLDHAGAQLDLHPRPTTPVGLVHGDAWLGNIMTTGAEVVGLIDWGCAGVGHPGVDLGHLRMSAVFEHGMPAPDDVLTGWQEEAGYPVEVPAYWDVIAALSTPADMGRLTQLRDTFLSDALERLGNPLA
jgi:aminoglycoside phosphotransferase (APT) family kinase protein